MFYKNYYLIECICHYLDKVMFFNFYRSLFSLNHNTIFGMRGFYVEKRSRFYILLIKLNDELVSNASNYEYTI